MTDSDRAKIIDVALDDSTIVRFNPDVDHERRVAIFDLLEKNHFAPQSGVVGPFKLKLYMQEARLVFDIGDAEDRPLETVRLPLIAFRRIIKEYFMVCESYYQAIKTASPSQIEALDMGRRGLHNDGSELLRERLSEKIDLDSNTARRLFTLICVLQIRG